MSQLFGFVSLDPRTRAMDASSRSYFSGSGERARTFLTAAISASGPSQASSEDSAPISSSFAMFVKRQHARVIVHSDQLEQRRSVSRGNGVTDDNQVESCVPAVLAGFSKAQG